MRLFRLFLIRTGSDLGKSSGSESYFSLFSYYSLSSVVDLFISDQDPTWGQVSNLDQLMLIVSGPTGSGSTTLVRLPLGEEGTMLMRVRCGA
jgi:type II secretory ATPase GspE/PulE/Tfp pilus assembly ATPase PilB-like protein